MLRKLTTCRCMLALLLAGLPNHVFSQANRIRVPSDLPLRATDTAVPTLPLPSGPFGIGRIGYEWIDTSRPDAYAARKDAHRDLVVSLWYPAPREYAGRTGLYLPSAKQMDQNLEVKRRVGDEFGPAWGQIVAERLVSHAVENAPVATLPQRFPLVLFSHGLGSIGLAYTSLIENLVSNGYVVASIEHTYTAMAVAFPDGRVVPFHQEAEPAGLTPGQRAQRMMTSAGLTISQGAQDDVFVLNQITERSRSAEHHFPIGERLDLNRVAAVGHSAGGAFATLACQMDQRFKACVSLDGAMPPVAAFPEYGKGFTHPVLLLEIDHSGQPRGFTDEQGAEYQKKKEAQLNACPLGSYDVVLKAPGLNHASFSDVPLLFASGKKETDEALYNLRATQAFTLSFLEKSLKDRAEGLFDDPSAYPGTDVRPYGH